MSIKQLFETVKTDKIIEPSELKKPDGKVRQVGYELEFCGVDIKEVVDGLIDIYGGFAEWENDFVADIIDSRIGEIGVELDARFFKQERHKEILEDMGIEEQNPFFPEISDFIREAAGSVIPLEITMPPIPVSEQGPAEELRKMLHGIGAKGTTASIAYAFGVHINVEPPDLKIDTLVRYFRAFLLLEETLYRQESVNFSRRLTPYIRPFERDFAEHILNINYQPNIDTFVDDYLDFSPTRNRSLDMLPLLSHLSDKIKKRLPQQKIISRPTFHYRLPNCKVDDPQWRIAASWNLWGVVEKLANDSQRLQQFLEEHNRQIQKQQQSLFSKWRENVEGLLE